MATTETTDRSTASWIPLHQDDGYGQLEPPLDVTVWTALTDTDESNGCLVVVPGSHRGGLVAHASADANVALLRGPHRRRAPRRFRWPAGEAVLFTGLTLHGSGPNRSGAPRVGMHARYCHPSVRMVTHRDKPVLADRHSWMVLGEAPGSPLSDPDPDPDPGRAERTPHGPDAGGAADEDRPAPPGAPPHDPTYAVFDDLTDVVVALDAVVRHRLRERLRAAPARLRADAIIGHPVTEFLNAEDIVRAFEVVALMSDDEVGVAITPALYDLRRSDGEWLPHRAQRGATRQPARRSATPW